MNTFDFGYGWTCLTLEVVKEPMFFTFFLLKVSDAQNDSRIDWFWIKSGVKQNEDSLYLKLSFTDQWFPICK